MHEPSHVMPETTACLVNKDMTLLIYIGTITATASNVSSTCIVLTLVAGRQDCQPLRPLDYP